MIEEKTKLEKEKESTTADPSDASPSRVDSSDWCPSSPAHLTFTRVILWILATNQVQWKKREGTKAYRDILSFLTLFSIFLEVICGERVYLGRPPRVGVRPSSRGKQEEKECGKCAGFSWHFGLFSWKAIQTRKVRQRSRIFFGVFCFDLFFGLMVVHAPNWWTGKRGKEAVEEETYPWDRKKRRWL